MGYEYGGNTMRDESFPSVHEPAEKQSVPGWSVLLVALFSGFLTPFDGSAVNIALPTMGSEFHLDALMLSWIATSYLLASAVFLVPFGRIADIFGRKRVFLSGIVTFTLSSLGMTMVPDGTLLIMIRIIQGIGSAMIFGTGVSMLTSVFPPRERGKVLGLYVTSVYLGLSAGPMLGGFLTAYLGWRSIFWINVPIGILIMYLILRYLKTDWADSHGEPFDLTGSLIYSCSLVFVMYGFSSLPDYSGVFMIIAGLFGFFLFIRYELRIPFPVLDLHLFLQNRPFTFSNLAALINYSATYAIAFLLSLDLQITRGFTPAHAGLILITQPIMQALISPFSGRLSDRVEPAYVSSAGMGLTTLGLFLLVFLDPDTPLWYYFGVLLLLGAGFGLFTSPNTNAVMGSVEKKDYGVASGILATMRLLGQTFSMGIAMMLLAIYVGPVEITTDLAIPFENAMHSGFIFFTVVCFAGIFFSLVRGRIHGNDLPDPDTPSSPVMTER